MFKTFLPFVHNTLPALKDIFADFGIRFGMAGEASSFDSSVQAPIILKHCATITAEVSGKMIYTNPEPGVYDYTRLDQLYQRCRKHNIAMFAHTPFWHIQNPEWLIPALEDATIEQGYDLLEAHITSYMEYCRGKMLGVDVVNEAGAILDGGGWIKYLGYDCVDFAFETAHGVDPGMPLYYNSFFASAEDEALAVYLLENDLADGIGIQLHLEASTDYQEKFLRAERVLRCCRKNCKTARISEVTVYDPENNLEHIGIIFRDTAFLAKDNRDVVTDYTVWGVKYPAWNGRHVLFDRAGKQTPAYYGIVNELVYGGL